MTALQPNVPDSQMTEDAKAQAKQTFRQCDNELLCALNGMGRPVGSQKEIVALRRALMQARHACVVQDVEVESLWEFAQKRRKIDEARVRHYAEEQSRITPRVSYTLRQRIAGLAGLAMAITVLQERGAWWWVQWGTSGGMLVTLVVGLVTFAIAEDLLASLFPTPAVRIARKACELGVDVSNLWAQGSAEFKDYLHAFKRHEYRLAQQGKLTGWIKAR